MRLAADFFRSKVTWTGVLGVAVCLTGGWEAVSRGTSPGIAWPVAIGSALKFLLDVFQRDTSAKAGEDIAQAVRETKGDGER